MIPIDLEGKPWPLDKANVKLQEFRAQALKELRARDSERGIPDDGKVYRIEEDGHGNQHMVIDGHLADQKHTGNETTNMTLDLWEAFCLDENNEPRRQDPSSIHVPVARSPRKADPKDSRRVVGEPVPQSGAPRTMSDTPVKRRRGRPRKDAVTV